MTVTITWLVLLTLLTGGFGAVDGIRHLSGRGRRRGLAVIELIVGALLFLSSFVTSLLSYRGWISLVLEIVLVVALVRRGRGRNGARGGVSHTLAVVALVLNSALLLVSIGWLHIPGVL